MPCALVLSAGGLFGAYQAGVWSVLAERFRPDLVVGASAGALNGWAIAGGATAAELLEVWRDPSIAALTRPRFSLLPWKGLADPGPLKRHVESLFARFQPRLPYSTTLVRVPRLHEVRVPGERMTPEQLMASCAVPLLFPPVRIDGGLYVDGGLLNILPLWAAEDMGADRAVAVNALPVAPNAALGAAIGVLRRLRARRAPAGMEVFEIRPREPLGSVRDALVWKAENIERFIRKGVDDGEAALGRMPAGWCRLIDVS